MAKPLRYLGQGTVYLLIVLVIGAFSDWPRYTRYPPELSVIKLSFMHGGKPKVPCRQRTAEELAKIAPNMRRQTVCSRERLPVLVEVELDGAPLYRASLPPAGLAGDGPSEVYQRFEVPAGHHELALRLRDTDRSEGFDYQTDTAIELAPQQSLAIDFRPSHGGFVLR
jgi:hypothetical protein